MEKEGYVAGFIVCMILSTVFFMLTIALSINNENLNKEIQNNQALIEILNDEIEDLEEYTDGWHIEKENMGREVVDLKRDIKEREYEITRLNREIMLLEQENNVDTREGLVLINIEGFETEKTIYYLSEKNFTENVKIKISRGNSLSKTEIEIPIVVNYKQGILKIKTGTTTMAEYNYMFQLN